MNIRVFVSMEKTLNGFPNNCILINADRESTPDFSCIVWSAICSVALKLTEHRNTVGSIFGCRPAFLKFCFIFGINLVGDVGLPTAGFIMGISTLEKYRLHAMARVVCSKSYFVLHTTYLAMHVCASWLIMRILESEPALNVVRKVYANNERS